MSPSPEDSNLRKHVLKLVTSSVMQSRVNYVVTSHEAGFKTGFVIIRVHSTSFNSYMSHAYYNVFHHSKLLPNWCATLLGFLKFFSPWLILSFINI